jgi:transcription elongation factor GreA
MKEKILLSREGLEKLKKDIFEQEKQYKELLSTKGEVMETGGNGWHDNASYDELMNQSRMFDVEIGKLKDLLNNSVIRDPDYSEKIISFGKLFLIENCEGKKEKIFITDQIMAGSEKGWVSYQSPLGKIFIGGKEGESKTITKKGKPCSVKILKIFDKE